MISATTPKARKPPVFCGSITQVRMIVASASSTTSPGRIAVFQCGCRWRTTSSWSVRTSSGNATRSAYVQHVTRGDAMAGAVSRTDHQLTVDIHVGRLADQLAAARQQGAHRPAVRRAPSPVRAEQPGQLGVAARLAPAGVPAGDAAQEGPQQRITVGGG